ncbi:MAG: NYN domain-containing protein, partial [Oscillospiraceae bacterium]|nr:NYN domain-containing protein [Oscillospiraceae bacterium]
LPSCLAPQKKEEHSAPRSAPRSLAVSDDELMAIFERTYGPIKRDKYTAMRKKPVHSDTSPSRRPVRRSQDETEYVLVDGYNIIFAWEELKKLAESDLDTARTRLIDILRNYQGYRETPVIVVFDAYKVKDNHGSVEHAGGLTVVYTKEAETADMFIEKAAYDLSRRHKVRVATSDRLEQLIILGNGALRISSEAFEEEVRGVLRDIRTFLEKTYYPDPLPQSRPIIKGESK